MPLDMAAGGVMAVRSRRALLRAGAGRPPGVLLSIAVRAASDTRY